MAYKLVAVLLLTCFSLLAKAQVSAYLDWPGDDICVDAAQLADGRTAALLESKDANGVSDACVVFLDAAANFLSRVCLPVSGVQTARAITSLGDSGFVITGKHDANGGDFFIARFDRRDSLLWVRTLGGGAEEEPQTIYADLSGDLLVAGYTRSFGGAQQNCYFAKYSKQGVLLWTRVFSTSKFDAAFRMLQIEGAYYLACNVNVSSVIGNGDLHLMKLDTSGKIIWTNVYGTTFNEHSWQMIRTLDGHIAMPMATNAFGGTNKEMLFLKIDTAGNILSSVLTEKANTGLDAFDLVQDSDSSYCLAGHCYHSTNSIHILVVRLDKNGNLLKARRSDFSEPTEVWRMFRTADFRYSFFGYGDKVGTPGSKLFVGQCDSSLQMNCNIWLDLYASSRPVTISVVRSTVFSLASGGTNQTHNWSFQRLNDLNNRIENNRNPAINSALPATLSFCKVDNVELDAGSFESWRWESGQTTRRINITDFGVYRVKVYVNGCFNTDSVHVKQIQATPFYLAGDTCGRDSLKLGIAPAPGYSYSWSNGSGSNETKVFGTGWYKATSYEPLTTCYFTDSIFVNLELNDHRLQTDSFSACLKGNYWRGKGQYQWNLPADSAIAGDWLVNGNPAGSGLSLLHNFTASGANKISLVSHSAKGCIDTTSLLVEIHPQPKPFFSFSDSSPCFPVTGVQAIENTQLEKGNYSITWSGDSFPVTMGTSVLSLSTPYTGDYRVQLKVVSDSGCADSLEKVLTVGASPVTNAIVTGDTSMCFGTNIFVVSDSTRWLGGPAETYTTEWRTDGSGVVTSAGTGAEISFTSPGTKRINLLLKSEHGCVDSSFTEVYVVTGPKARLFVSDSSICGRYQQLEATDSSITNGLVVHTTLETGDGTRIDPFVSVNHTYADTGDYLLKLKVIAAGECSDSLEMKVRVDKVPLFDLTLSDSVMCFKGNLLNAAYAGPTLPELYWTMGDGAQYDNVQSVQHSYADAGSFSLLLTGGKYGCYDTIRKAVTIHPSPEVAFTSDPVCFGEESFFVSTSSIKSGTLVNWYWTIDNTIYLQGETTSHTFADTGDYDVKLVVESDKLCRDSLTIPKSAKVRAITPASFRIDTLERSYSGDVYRLIGLNDAAVLHEWKLGTGEIYSGQNVNITVRDSMSLELRYRTVDEYGCESELVQIVLLDFNPMLAIPNAFTPGNRDDLNSTFRPVGIKFNTDYEMLILNRWGQVIFQSHNPDEGWDGTFKGEACSSGIYVYQIRIDSGKYEFYGTLHLLR